MASTEDRTRLAPMRRSATMVAVLARLRRRKTASQLHEALMMNGIVVEERPLKELLRRLVKQEVINSESRGSGKALTRYYVLSEPGRATLTTMAEEWRQLNHCLEGLLAEVVR